MKIRKGFVSNSSTTSFCIYGKHFCDYDVKEKIKEVNEKLKEAKISVYESPYDDIYVGRDFCLIDDSETGLEFKKSTEKTMKKIFGDDIECTTITEGWWDG